MSKASKAVSFRLNEKNNAIIQELLNLNSKNFYPKNVDTRSALLNLMISAYGQQLLDAANEGKKFDQEMSKHFYLSKKDSHVIRSIYNNTKKTYQILIMAVMLIILTLFVAAFRL